MGCSSTSLAFIQLHDWDVDGGELVLLSASPKHLTLFLSYISIWRLEGELQTQTFLQHTLLLGSVP